MPGATELLRRLDECPLGREGWRQYEDICIDILEYLFAPPLERPTIRSRTLSGLDIRDAIFPNRITDQGSIWGQLRQELDARMILFEFKNYDIEDIGSEEVDQVRNYLRRPLGKLGVMICSKEPHINARKRRNQVYTDEEKVIILMTSDHLREMIHMKERGDDPARFFMEQVELFYIEYE